MSRNKKLGRYVEAMGMVFVLYKFQFSRVISLGEDDF